MGPDRLMGGPPTFGENLRVLQGIAPFTAKTLLPHLSIEGCDFAGFSRRAGRTRERCARDGRSPVPQLLCDELRSVVESPVRWPPVEPIALAQDPAHLLRPDASDSEVSRRPFLQNRPITGRVGHDPFEPGGLLFQARAPCRLIDTPLPIHRTSTGNLAAW